jgi:capsular polysaccharide transport system ATP-binding protein
MIEIKGISKTFTTKSGENCILQNLNFSIEKNDNIGILGRNGAGKSTLLRIIAGIEEPDHGIVERRGRISWPIGFSGGFNGSLTGEENCHFVARIYGEEIEKVLDFVTDFSELGDYFYMPFRTYSAGMKARLAFGLSMALEFDLYLVDEVTAVGDISFQRKCKEVFAERRKRSSILIVSHNLNTIKEYCNKVVILDKGKIQVYNDIDMAFNIYNQGFENGNDKKR